MNAERLTHREADGGGHAGTVARVVHLLEVIATGNGELGVRALARDTGIDKSTVSRLLGQLAQLDMLEPSGTAGRYRIGPRFFAVSAAVTSKDELWRASRPILERLVHRFNETSYLAVRERDEVVFREKVECDQPIRYVIDLGRPFPLHAGAAGRAILIGLPDDEVNRILDLGHLSALTPDTITDPDELRGRLAEDRKRGYAISIGERSVGATGIAAPFFGADGRCGGSLVTTMPQGRFDRARAGDFGEALVSASAELSMRLGYGPSNRRESGSGSWASTSRG